MEKLTSCDRDWRMGCARSKLIPCLNAMDETISKSRTLNGSYHHGLRAKMCLASMSLAAGGFGPSGVNKSTPPPTPAVDSYMPVIHSTELCWVFELYAIITSLCIPTDVWHLIHRQSQSLLPEKKNKQNKNQ